MTLYYVMPEPAAWATEKIINFLRFTTVFSFAITYGPMLLAIALLGTVFICKYIKRKKNSEKGKSRK